MSVTGLDFGVTVLRKWGTREHENFIQEAFGG
jgi:hypothetical protein